jgi:hypothetical protein
MAISAQATSPFALQKGEGTSASQEEQRRRFEEAQQKLWDAALRQAEQQRLAAEQYGLEAEQMRTAAQQQLGAGIEQTRTDIMAGAGARGLNPALGRAAGYAGGQLGQRGVGMGRALQARELAAAQAQQQEALAAQAGLQMGLSEQALGAQAAESQAWAAYQALAAQQAAQQQAAEMGYGMAGLGAAATLGAMAGGAYSDRELKAGVRQPVSAAEAQLLNALRAEGQRTEGALEAATGRAIAPQQATDARVAQLTAQLQAEGARTEQRLGALSGQELAAMGSGTVPVRPGTGTVLAGQGLGAMSQAERQRMMLGSLSGAGRQYEYTPQAQQQLGQPAGVQYGPMAQDLAKTELGRSAVIPTPAGLAVDTGRLSMIQAGLMGEQQRQIDEIRKQLQAEGRKTEARLGRATR